jgi:predicted DNA binding protein
LVPAYDGSPRARGASIECRRTTALPLYFGDPSCCVMTLYETAFRLQHDCPFNELSKQNPELVISSWCNSETDVMEISAEDPAAFNALQKDLKSVEKALKTKITRRSNSSRNIQIVIQHCGCENVPAPVSPVFEKNNCLELQPTIYKGGWEYYRLISFSEKDMRKVFATLEPYCKVEVISRRVIPSGAVKETMLVSTSSLFGGLTRKQVQALVFALENGYYQVPKRVTTEEMASKLRLPRTTYEEHLRKAEGKVLRSMAPYISLGPAKSPDRSGN